MTTPAVPVAAPVDIVIPTVGRPALATLIARLAHDDLAPVESLTVVDDRPHPRLHQLATLLGDSGLPARGFATRVLATGGRGPAAARNAGWRAGTAPWVAFLDDDVVPEPGWGSALAADVAGLPPDVAAVRGRVRVPRPEGRRPTDWERQVEALSHPPGWLTADLVVRRQALEDVGGLDERFPRAHREDTDLELRIRAAGWRDALGRRAVVHPVGPVDRWVSVRRQRGNADDVLLARLHGRDWRADVGEPPGAIRQHVATVAAGTAALACMAGGRRAGAAGAAAVWAGLTARFAWRRIAPGPRDREEVVTMLLTSVAIPPVAVRHRLAGWWRWRRVRPYRPPEREAGEAPSDPRPLARLA